MSPARALAYMLASVTLAMTQQNGANLVNTNVYQIQGQLGATIAETNWLIAAYMAPNVSLSIALIKIRMQHGLRRRAGNARSDHQKTGLFSAAHGGGLRGAPFRPPPASGRNPRVGARGQG